MPSAGFEEEGPDSAAAMEHAFKWILKYGGGLAFILIIAWPCLALPAGVFSKGYFTFWVIISIIWGLVSLSVAYVLSCHPCPQSCMMAPEGLLSLGCRPFELSSADLWSEASECPQNSLCIACWRLMLLLTMTLLGRADQSCRPLLQVWSSLSLQV